MEVIIGEQLMCMNVHKAAGNLIISQICDSLLAIFKFFLFLLAL